MEKSGVCVHLSLLLLIQVAVWITPAAAQIDIGGDCTNNTTGCITGTVCESTSTSNTCKLEAGGDCSGGNSTNCKSDTTCEGDICKLEAGQNCSASNDCQNGTTCDSGICRLEAGQSCTAPNANNCKSGTTCEGDICKYTVGSVCDTNIGSCVTNAVCEFDGASGSTVCKLEAGQSCSAPNNNNNCKSGTTCEAGTCKLEAGQSCSAPNTNNCKSGTTCEAGTCKLEAGQSCSAPNTNNCKSGTTCEAGTCKLEAGQSCSAPNTNNCKSGTTCEAGTCKLEAGQSCSAPNTNNCKSGTTCEAGTCKLEAGQSCSAPNTNNCKSGTTCEAGNCKLEAGQSCSAPNTNNCKSGTTCEAGTCKLEAGQSCSAPNTNNCKSGTTCEAGTCKLEAGQSCSAPNTNNCKSGTTCEAGTCKLEAGQSCSAPNTNNCKSGTTCEAGTCKLEAGQSCSAPNTNNCKSGTTCEAGNCKLEAGQSCSAPNTNNCKSGTTCEAGTCKLEAGQSCSAPNNNNNCKSGTTCEAGTCKLVPGQSCSAPNTNNCKSGTTCEAGTCKLEAGQSCSAPNTNNCKSGTTCEAGTCKLEAGQSCSAPNTNNCKSGTTCEAGTCKLVPGQSCSGSNTNNCKSGTTCDGGICKTSYGNDCSSGQCATTLQCRPPDSGGNSKCLCGNDRYRYNGACVEVSQLEVTNIQRPGNPEETNLAVRWRAPSKADTSNQLTYRVTVTPDDSTQQGVTGTTVTFTNRKQGTGYTVSVYTSAIRDPGFNTTRIETSAARSSQVYTKPAMPGPLEQEVHSAPDVTLRFTASVGNVDHYTVQVLQQTSQAEVGFQTVQTSQASFSGLVAGEMYTVKITAVSGGISSNIRTDTFPVAEKPAGPVNQLTVPELGSRWIQATWQKPVNPNGAILGYTVRAMTEAMECVSGLSIFCSDCTNYNESLISAADTCTQRTVPFNKTKTELDNPSLTLTVNVTHLQPYVNYTVKVTAYNTEGRGQDSDVTRTTDQEAAQTVKSVTIVPQADNQLTVSWEPAEKTGPTTYTVSWSEQENLGSSSFRSLDSVNVSGYENTRYTISGLLSYWQYEVSVFPFTDVADPPAAVITGQNTTLPTKPGPVTNLAITQPSNTAQSVQLTVTCPEERERNGPITSFGYTSVVVDGGVNSSQTAPADVIPVSSGTCSASGMVNVVAESSYIFKVFAKTTTHNGVESEQNVTILPKPPEQVKPADGSALVTEASSTTSTVTVDVCSCIVNPTEGQIILAGITVCVQSATDTCEPDPNVQTMSSFQSQHTWKQFKAAGEEGRYVATSADFHTLVTSQGSRQTRSVSQNPGAAERKVPYTIGDNTTCEQLADNVFCNGPLPAGKTFKLIFWACTKGGCTEFSEVLSVKTRDAPDETSVVGPVVGTIVGVLVVAAIVVIVIVIYRRRRSGYVQKTDDSGLDPPERIVIRRAIKLKNFSERLEQLHKDANLLFQEQYEEIQENTPKHFTQEAASLDENKIKNRYVNILPYDHTRVKLQTDDDDETTDFINANYIPGYSSPREYIATQGPMVGTVEDFWRMVWEQRSSLIIMLSDLTEKGRPKVDMYWPGQLNEPVQYGNIVVELKSDSTLNKYTIRTFNILMEDHDEAQRRVVQYFIPGWEDYSANLNPEDVIEFIKSTRQEARSSQGPIVVHCSAGVGRTGTFIALDFLIQFVRDHNLDDEVDIYNLVLNMRHNRPFMVQSEKQYVFIHDTLKVIIDMKIKEMEEEDGPIYANNTEDVYVNQAFVLDENVYENTSPLKPTTVL